MTTILTHNGTYHADDVFAVATLLLIEPNAKIIRTRDKELIHSADYIVDIGFVHDPSRKLFDHHQPGGAGERLNGIPYASFGLVWKEYGESLAHGKAEAAIIDRILVQPLDAHDNGVPIADYRYDGVRSYALTEFLYSYLPEPQETDENLYKIFLTVVEIARGLLIREIAKARETVISDSAVRRIYDESKDKRLIVLDREYEWQYVLMNTPDATFVVYPRNDKSWGVKSVPASSKVYGMRRKDFPKEWGGRVDEDLQQITGVGDAFFAHRGLFMVAARTKEGAIELAEKALNA